MLANAERILIDGLLLVSILHTLAASVPSFILGDAAE